MLKKLINPFESFTDKKLLQIGFIALFLGSILAFSLNGRYDGLLNFHFYNDVKFWQPLIDLLINAVVYSNLLFFVGYFINKKTRKVDFFIISLWTQMPFYILPVFNIGNKLKDFEAVLIESITKNPHDISFLTHDPLLLIILIIMSLFSILGLIIFFYWSWMGFKWATNTKNYWHILVLVLTVILASFISKFLIHFINT